jgi:hypothetical protein
LRYEGLPVDHASARRLVCTELVPVMISLITKSDPTMVSE